MLLPRVRSARTPILYPFWSGNRRSSPKGRSHPYLDLASVPYYESYEKRYPSKARKNRRRRVHRFEERPPQKYTSCHRDNGPANSPYR